LGRKNRSRRQRERRQPASGGAPSELSFSRGWLIALILGVTFLAFSNTVLNGFAYDDTTQIVNNPFIRDLRNVPKALVTEAWYWRAQQDKDPNEQDKPSTSYYRPIVMIYLMIMWKLFGASAPGWHIFNILLHLLAVYFAFLILERVTKDRRLSAIASLLFAVHPFRSESVAWVSGVTDLLMAVFLLPAFFLYVRYREEGKPKLLAASSLLFLFGAFTKEPAVVLPLFLVCYELFIINRDKRLVERIKPAAIYGGVYLLLAVGYLVARYYALGFALNNSNFKSYPPEQIVLTIPLVIWKYIALLVWPVDLSLFHGTPMIKTPVDFQFILPFVGLIALTFGLWKLRRSIVARFAILWFAVNLLPVLNLGAFASEFMVQERYVYVPSLGFALLVAMALAKIADQDWLPFRNRRAAQVALAGLLVFLFAGKSFAQNAAWRDDMTVWYHGVEAAPEQAMSHYILGHKLIKLGEYGKSAEQFEDYLKLSPDNVIAITNLASDLVLKYQYQAASNPATADRAIVDRALELAQRGLELNPKLPSLWDTLGTIYTFETGLKNYDRAVACYQRALSLTPGNANAMMSFHLGGTLVKKGDFDNGVRYLRSALEQESRIVDAHKFLAYAYKAKGQLKEAADELGIYLQLQPDAPDASRVRNDLQDLRAQLQSSSPQS
jgi:protein O-mannosyl-transferase